MVIINLTLPTPVDFNLHAVVTSHGWYQLLPFAYDGTTLTRQHRLRDGAVVDIAIRAGQSQVLLIDVVGLPLLTSLQRHEITQAVSTILSLDWDLRGFYDFLRKLGGYEWVLEQHIGRLQVSPTVWEDLVKTLFSTNTTWKNTIMMTRRLVELDPDGTFPTPQQIATFSVDNVDIGAGYRTAYLLELAQKIVSGECDVESWRTLSSDDLYKQVRALKGFGDYAAGTMTRLLGHFDRLAIDSVARAGYTRVTGKTPTNDKEIQQHYESYGAWRGLVLWMDCISDEYE